MSVFFDAQSNLRSGWKLFVFVIAFMPVWIATSFVLTLIFEAAIGLRDDLQDLALGAVIRLIAVAIASFFVMRIVEHRRIRALGVGLHEGYAGNLGAGMGIASGLIVLLMLATLAFGETHIEWTAAQSSLGRFVLTVGLLIVAAIFEELVFRGYPLQVLMKGIGPWPAMLAMSCVFGLLHKLNPNSSWLGTFNTIVAGMMLSLAYFKTRSLWYPFGLHLGWNIGIGMVVGFPLSGQGIPSFWTTHVTGASWLLGGGYGPEGGLLGTLIFLMGAAAVWKVHISRINYDDRLYKDTRAG